LKSGAWTSSIFFSGGVAACAFFCYLSLAAAEIFLFFGGVAACAFLF
jgi:hypothetical protein